MDVGKDLGTQALFKFLHEHAVYTFSSIMTGKK